MQCPRSSIRRLLIACTAIAIGCNGADTPTEPDDTPIVPHDDSPPAAIGAIDIVYLDDSDDVRLSWLAPHDDTSEERVVRYEIRHAYTRGADPTDFWVTSALLDAPSPSSPGDEEVVIIEQPRRGRDLFVGVRSYDEEDNISPVSPIVRVRLPGYAFAGTCVNGLTGEPIEGLSVTLMTGPVVELVSDAAGEFAASDLQPGGLNVEIVGPSLPVAYHRLSQSFVLDRDRTHTFIMIPRQSTISPALNGVTVLELFKFLAIPAVNDGVLAKWRRLPVPVYVRPSDFDGGVDYDAETRLAAARWMDKSGADLFTFVGAPPDTGITVVPRPREEMGISIAVTHHTTGNDKHPIQDRIDIRDDMTDRESVFRILLHELGHTIRLGHLSSSEFIMYGGHPLPGDISDDETTIIRLHAALPSRVNMNIYDTATE